MPLHWKTTCDVETKTVNVLPQLNQMFIDMVLTCSWKALISYQTLESMNSSD